MSGFGKRIEGPGGRRRIRKTTVNFLGSATGTAQLQLFVEAA